MAEKFAMISNRIPIPNPAPRTHHTPCHPVKPRHIVSPTPVALCVDPRPDQQSSGGRHQRLEAESRSKKWILTTRDQSKGCWFDPVIVRLRILAAPPTRLSGRQPRNRAPAPTYLRFCRGGLPSLVTQPPDIFTYGIRIFPRRCMHGTLI